MAAEWIFWIGLALSPFYNVLVIPTPAIEISAVEIIFICAFILWFPRALFKWDSLSFNRIYRFLILFMIIALVSCFFADSISLSIKRWGKTFLYFLIFAVMLPSLMSQSRKWRVYIFLFILSGTLFGAINYWELFLFPSNFMSSFFVGSRIVAKLPLVTQEFSESLGVFQNYGHEIGHWDSAILPIIIGCLVGMVNRWGKTFLISCFIVSMITLVLSMTKSAWGGLLVALIYMFLRYPLLAKHGKKMDRPTVTGSAKVTSSITVRSERIIYGIIITFVVLVIIAVEMIPDIIKQRLALEFLLKGQSAVSRFEIWQQTFSAFLENPLFGIGLQGFLAKDLPDPHNWWLGILSQIGILGFISWCLFFLSLIYSFDVKLKTLREEERYVAWSVNAALLGLAFRGLFQMSFMWAVNVWFCIGLGLFFIVKNINEPSLEKLVANA